MKLYYEDLFDEIMQIIRDNLELLYNYNEDTLINIRNYCHEHSHRKYEPLTYNKLSDFAKEAITEIIDRPHLYDFRSLE